MTLADMSELRRFHGNAGRSRGNGWGVPMFCSNCGAAGQRSGKQCSRCNYVVHLTTAHFRTPTTKICETCNYINEPNRNYCEHCGERLIAAEMLYASRAAELAALANDRPGTSLLLQLLRNPRQTLIQLGVLAAIIALLVFVLYVFVRLHP
jgi:hypothetical protein